jgi:hypothetical protein
MRLYAKFLLAIGVLALAALGFWLCWMGFRLPVRAKTAATPLAESHTAQYLNTPATAATSSTTANSTQSGGWADTIDTALTTGVNEAGSAQMLLNALPGLPVAGQIEAAEHIVNLLPDAAYVSAGAYLTNTAVAADVREVLFSDLLNRPNSIKLAWLLEVARTPGLDQAEEAKDTLEVFLGEDYGANWNVWSDKIRVWLRDNPE